TVLRPNWFMSILLAAREAIAAAQLAAPLRDTRLALIDPADIAAAAAVGLTDASHGGPLRVLTGPRALPCPPPPERLWDVLGRPVGFVDLPEAVVLERMVAAGAPEWLQAGVIGQYTEGRNGVTANVTDTVEVLTGRPPRSFAAYVRDHAAEFTSA